MKMITPWRLTVVQCALAIVLPGEVRAATIPPLPDISPTTASVYPALVRQRKALLDERSRLRDQTVRHNAACVSVLEGSPEEAHCDGVLVVLSEDVDRHVSSSWKFIERHLKTSMSLSAKRLKGWSDAEGKRLRTALNALKPDGDFDAGAAEIRMIWHDVLARSPESAPARQSVAGEGPGLNGASAQAGYQDCAVFALATAAGLPYGMVAARAAELVRDGEWRPAGERKNPQEAIEQGGLLGGELLLLGEIFGQVEVVSAGSFAKTLRGGHPVMVNLVPADGDTGSGHQVVLSKTFQHSGETWFEMVDSNQGPVRRLYLSARELAALQQENGITFRPEKRTRPQLFR